MNAALFGDMFIEIDEKRLESRSLDEEGNLTEDCPPLALHFYEAINVFEDISGTESFFEEWNSYNKSMKALLQDKSLQIALCAIDTHILKAAFCENNGALYEKISAHFESVKKNTQQRASNGTHAL